MKFSNDKPIEQILTDFMSRGGDDKDFVRAMYEVGRRFKLIPYDQILENRENRRLENRIQGELFYLKENRLACFMLFNFLAFIDRQTDRQTDRLTD